MTTIPYTPPTFRDKLSAMLAETRLRLLNVSRYPGQLVMEFIIPIVFAAMPMLLGQATAGDQAAANFAANTGTANYVAYLLIGANIFSIVSSAFWHIAYWVRFEQETGTLEAIYLTPTSTLTLASCVALYSVARGLTAAILAYLAGCLIFQVNPLMGSNLIIVVFAVVVIGGMASIMGSIITGLALGLIEGLTKVFYPEASSVVVFVIMVIVLLVRPAGLFGKS